jgi:tetratricopeptide (TPR) repeat protein
VNDNQRHSSVTPVTKDSVESLRRQALEHPQDLQLQIHLADLQTQLQEWDQAKSTLDRAIECHPQHASLYAQSAMVSARLGNWSKCLTELSQALALEPHNPHFLCNLSHVLITLEQWDDAVATARVALANCPNHSYAYELIGLAFLIRGEWLLAAQNLLAAIDLDPQNAQAHNNIGLCYRELGESDLAIAAFKKATLIDSTFSDAYFNLGTTYLLEGDFIRGWPLYLHHKREQQLADQPNAGALWTGKEPLNSRSILIYREQGLGDTFQFVRYLSALDRLGARVYFAPHDSLRAILRISGLPYTEASLDDRTTQFDYHCPLLSLPALLIDSEPAQVPYIIADPKRISAWRTRLGTRSLKVGIHWQGSTGRVDVGRSIPLEYFKTLAIDPQIRLISLQKGEGLAQLGPETGWLELLDGEWDGNGNGFVDSAAILSGLDLVITSDSALAHLAGAMGIKTWVLLKKVPDWRWLREGSRCPWYPSLTLYRQSVNGDWAELFERVGADLKALL